MLQDAAEKRNRRLSARRASFSGLEDVYKVIIMAMIMGTITKFIIIIIIMIMNMILKDLDEVYQKDEELRQQERSRSRMQSEERFPFSKT